MVQTTGRYISACTRNCIGLKTRMIETACAEAAVKLANPTLQHEPAVLAMQLNPPMLEEAIERQDGARENTAVAG